MYSAEIDDGWQLRACDDLSGCWLALPMDDDDTVVAVVEHESGYDGMRVYLLDYRLKESEVLRLDCRGITEACELARGILEQYACAGAPPDVL